MLYSCRSYGLDTYKCNFFCVFMFIISVIAEKTDFFLSMAAILDFSIMGKGKNGNSLYLFSWDI